MNSISNFTISLMRGDDGFWVVTSPDFPGCVTQGETLEIALKNMAEAIELYVEELDGTEG